ncbi:MAG: 5'-nucleotidase [Deltaproteobacteria bacterium]|jgi:5'-nucleotidase|nr:5'-nucleotidase [Deltaproteobacteria bacterium]
MSISTQPLTIAISSRALFDLSEENNIFETQGMQAFADHQRKHEDLILRPGPAFSLVKVLLNCNQLIENKQFVEVVITSKNSHDTALRVLNSIQHYGLDIRRAIFTGGTSVVSYLKAFQVGLFLSASAEDVALAANSQIASGLIYGDSTLKADSADGIRIAFDGDAVIFSGESEIIYKTQGIEAFEKHEIAKAKEPLPDGPFAQFLRTLCELQQITKQHIQSNITIRTALVTARNSNCYERVTRTLRAWNIIIDETFFLDGMDKTEILAAFNPQIFFDDQSKHCDRASKVVPTARVLS